MAKVATRQRVAVEDLPQRTHARTTGPKLATDYAAVGLLLVLTALVAWNRAAFDMWLARIDILQQLLPYYWFLGQQLREFNIPGWNPHQLSGMPFAADPLSGWMQFPVMVLFTFLDPVPAFKALMTFHLGFAALTTYAFARVLGLGTASSLVGAVAFAFGNFIHYNTYYGTIVGNLTAWIPLALLGVELALHARSWVARAAAINLSGLALSQMLAAWIGQGAYYGLLMTGGYVLYRTVISPPVTGWSLRQRVLTLGMTGTAVLVGGFGLAAAGVLPRLAVNRHTNLSGGNYDLLGSASNDGWELESLIHNLFDPEFVWRRFYLGTAVIMLAILAPFVARRRYAVPFFVLLTTVCMILVLDTTPLHRLFYLLPQFQPLHQHSEHRILGVILIGPAMLAAATVESLQRIRVRLGTLVLGLLPAVLYAVVRVYLDANSRWLPHHVWVVVLGVTALLLGLLVMRLDRDWRLLRPLRPGTALIPIILVAVLFWDPAGKDILDSLRGRSESGTYQTLLETRTERAELVQLYTACQDPGGAGEFLTHQLDEQPAPFRYFGYDAAGLRYKGQRGTSYHAEQASPNFQGLLVATRATCLRLYDVQGYSPVQLQRYVNTLQAINGVGLNYHDAVILPPGIDTPVLNLLNAAYIITPYDIPAGGSRRDLTHVAATRPLVFQNGQVAVFRNERALPHAWVVHDAHQVRTEQVLDLLMSGRVDPRRTVLVEQPPPPLDASFANGSDVVRFVAYEPDRIALDVEATGAGMLVLSEVYEPGWRAYVDGEEVSLFAADYILRGVPVPNGAHRVELRYEPISLRLGLWISSVTALAMAAALLIVGWREVRARRGRKAATL